MFQPKSSYIRRYTEKIISRDIDIEYSDLVKVITE
jgi:hypothetical protein